MSVNVQSDAVLASTCNCKFLLGNSCPNSWQRLIYALQLLLQCTLAEGVLRAAAQVV